MFILFERCGVLYLERLLGLCHMNIEKIERLADFIIKAKLNTLSPSERVRLNEWLFASDTNLNTYSSIMSGDFLASKFLMEDELSQIYNISIIKREIVRKITKKHQKSRIIKLSSLVASSAAVLVFLTIGYFTFFSPADSNLKKQSSEDALAMASKIEPFTNDSKVILKTFKGEVIELDPKNNEVIENSSQTIKAENNKNIKVLLNTITTPRGTTFHMTLSDGTKVWINENSKLIYPVQFPKNRREVSIEGEAYFEIVHNPSAPFYVVGSKGRVRVIGTKFNFVSTSEQTVTTLVEGSVEVNSPTTKLVISPSQQAVVSDDIQVKEVDVSLFTAWKDGKYIFKSKNLSEVMDYLAKWYDVKIEYDESVKKDIKLTGVIVKFTTFAQVIEVLEATKQISIKVKDENTVKIFSK